MKYNFGEKKMEYSAKTGGNVEVFITPKYEQSKAKAIEIIEKYDNINTGDFWILMNETKTGKMMYSGLIISHNACLKINDHMAEKDRFDPSSVSIDKDGYADSLVFTYCNPTQGIYEVGEVAKGNCKNAYPYAMAFKRLFDRVVLKLCKLAYDGVYSDSEADEFAERQPEPSEQKKAKGKSEAQPEVKMTREEIEDKIVALCDANRLRVSDICKSAKVTDLSELTEDRLNKCLEYVIAMINEGK